MQHGNIFIPEKELFGNEINSIWASDYDAQKGMDVTEKVMDLFLSFNEPTVQCAVGVSDYFHSHIGEVVYEVSSSISPGKWIIVKWHYLAE